jgi:succinate-semialdehyde dehydrogenase/glutarate-semialdehyde dehydrogenase
MAVASTISAPDKRADRLKTPRDRPEKEQTRAVLQSVNPFSGELLKTYAEMSVDEVEEAIARAHEKFATWKRTSFSERAGFLRRAAALCVERMEQLAKLMTLEMGKRIAEARKEIKLCAAIFEYYARNGQELLQPERIQSRLGDGSLLNPPLGVIFGIEPWNYPAYQVVRFAAPTLMAGNTVVLKHASNVQQCAEALEAIFRDAGFPPGAYTNLAISSRLANQVIDDDRVQGVSFTGSDGAGAKVAERAGRNVKKTILELGGSDPFVVLEDADMNLTIDRAVTGKMTNMGQWCVAAKRFILLERIADEFIERFCARLAKLKMGNPLDDETGVAPLSSARAAEQLEKQVNRSVAGGAKLILGGKRPSPDSAFFEATILTNVQKGTPAYDEELFGPVASVFVVSNEEKAISVANDTKYGLGGSVYSRDENRARRVADEIDAGMVYINHPAWIYEDVPFGGIKKSGYGRECGPLGIEEFVNKKLVRSLVPADAD